MKVYFVVVTYNATKWLDKCFGSLRGHEVPVQVIAVDNGSTDQTVDLLKEKFPEVEIIQPETNIGFGKGNNVGIKHAIEQGADFVYLLNQDAYLLKGSLSKISDVFQQNPQAGLISPIHLAGNERDLDFGFYKYVHPADTPFLLGDIAKGEIRSTYETKYVNAAAWILKSCMIKQIGMFHPIFDHYGEDREYISRMEKSGFKSLIWTESFIVHDRPQNRKGNDYHTYGKTITRSLLQALIEKETTYWRASFTLLKLSLRNLLTANPRNALRILDGWIWLTKKNKQL